MPSPINISVNYSAQVQEAIKAANDFNKQFGQMQQATKDQIIKTAQLQAAVTQLGNVSVQAFGKATAATRSWSAELTRVGVFVNKTMASLAGGIQSFSNQIKSALGGVSGGVGGVFGGAQGLIGDFSRTLSDFIGTGGFVQGLSRAVASGAKGFVKVGTDIGAFIIKGIGVVASSIPKLLGELTQIGGSITGLFAGAGASLFKAGGIAVGLFVSGITNAAGSVVKAFGNILEGVTNLAVTAFSGIGDTIASALGGAIEIVGAFGDRIAAIIGDVGAKIGDVLGKAVAAGLAVGLPVAFKGAQFRSELTAAFGVVADEVTAAQFEELVDKSKDVAREIGLSLGQIPQALFKQVSFGFKDIDTSVTGLRDAAHLAAIGNVDLFKAIEAINISMAAYRDTLTDTNEVAVKLFNATRKGRLEVEDLTEHLGLVVGNAEAAGVSFEELLTIINLANRTLASSTAVFGIGNAIKSLQKPTKEATEDFKTFFDAIAHGDGTLKSFRVVLEELQRSGVAFDPKAFREIFPDERGARAVRAIMKAVGKDFSDYNATLKLVNEDSVTFGKVSEFAMNQVIRRLTALGASVVSVGDAFVNKFKAPIIAGFDAVSNVLKRFEQGINSIDPKFIEKLQRDIEDFITTIPSKLKGVIDSFKYVGNAILDASRAAKKFADENLNLTATFEALLSGQFQSAFDLFFGSNAITKVKGFFSVLVAEAKNALSFVQSIGKAILSGIGGAAGSLGGSGIGKLVGAIGGGGDFGDPTELLLQTVAGVNPVQKGAKATAAAGTGAAIGGALGGAVGGFGFAKIGAAAGTAIAPGVGTLIGGAVGAAVGALTLWAKSIAESNAVQEAINKGLAEAREEIKKQFELMKARNAAAEKGQAALTAAEQEVNKLLTLRIKQEQTISNFKDNEAIILGRIAEQQKVVDDFQKRTAEAHTRGYKNLLEYAEAVGNQRADIEILHKLDERRKKVQEKTAELYEAFNNRLIDVGKELDRLYKELKDLKNPPQVFITRSGTDRLGGSSLNSLAGSQRDVSTVGGDFEGRLIGAIEDLIDALEGNRKAQESLKNALKPENLNENNKFLSSKARRAIRKDREARERAEAEVINNQFDSTGLVSVGQFGFGGSSTDRFLRQQAFGGGAFGVGGQLPGQQGAGVDARLISQIMAAIAAGQGQFLSIQKDVGLVNIADRLTGGRSDTQRVRGKASAFDQVGGDELSKLKAAIEKMAEVSQIFGKGADIKKELAELEATARKELETGATQVDILKEMARALEEQIKQDKDAKKRLDDNAAEAKKKKEIDEKEREKADLQKKRADAGDIAEATTPAVQDAEIRAKRVAEEKASAQAAIDAVKVAEDKLFILEAELQVLNNNFQTEMGILQAEVDFTIKEASQKFQELSDTTIETMDKFLDIGRNLKDGMGNLDGKLNDVYKRADRIDKEIEDINKKIKGK